LDRGFYGRQHYAVCLVMTLHHHSPRSFASLFNPSNARDPKIEDLEKSLADRQAQESHDLALKQTAELNRLGPSQQLTDRHRQEWEEQTKDFAKEPERFIVEFYDAQRMLEELREREKQESLERGDEHGKDLGFSR
jgi:hypothetical protein